MQSLAGCPVRMHWSTFEVITGHSDKYNDGRNDVPSQTTTAQQQLYPEEAIVKNLHYIEVSAKRVKLFYMYSVF